jgi:hypothetical protein
MKKIKIIYLLLIVVLASCSKPDSNYKLISQVPDIKMPDNHLKFKEIEDYKNYKIVGTHFRTDKNELRYILANDKAFKSYNEKTPFPNGSKIVKIGWTVEKMSNFNPALEANEIQRIEYMIKDDKRFSDNPGNWGYARFVKKDDTYLPWTKGTKGCISCHNITKNNDYLFTKMQALQ